MYKNRYIDMQTNLTLTSSINIRICPALSILSMHRYFPVIPSRIIKLFVPKFIFYDILRSDESDFS